MHEMSPITIADYVNLIRKTYEDFPPIKGLGNNLEYEEKHFNCTFCYCFCRGLRNASIKTTKTTTVRIKTKILKCEHCLYYERSTPKRCFADLDVYCGDIAYILRIFLKNKFLECLAKTDRRVGSKLIVLVREAIEADPNITWKDSTYNSIFEEERVAWNKMISNTNFEEDDV